MTTKSPVSEHVQVAAGLNVVGCCSPLVHIKCLPISRPSESLFQFTLTITMSNKTLTAHTHTHTHTVCPCVCLLVCCQCDWSKWLVKWLLCHRKTLLRWTVLTWKSVAQTADVVSLKVEKYSYCHVLPPPCLHYVTSTCYTPRMRRETYEVSCEFSTPWLLTAAATMAIKT